MGTLVKLKWISLVIVAVLLSPNLSAQTQGFTLEQSVRYALENQKNIRVAEFDMYMAKQQADGILATGWPQVSAKFDFTDNISLPTFILPAGFDPMNPEQPVEAQFGTRYQMNAGISINQLLFDATFFIGIKGARVYEDVARIDVERVKEDVVLEVSKAYYSALIAQEQLKILDANLKRLKKLYDDTRILNENGFAEKIDVERLKINYTNLQLERDKAGRLASLSKDLLKFQMGMPVTADINLTEKIEVLENETAPKLETALDLHNRLEYRVLQRNVDLQELNVRRLKATNYPSIYGGFGYTLNTQRDRFGDLFTQKWFDIGYWGLTVNVPIFDGFGRRAEMRRVSYQVDQLKTHMEILDASMNLQLKSSYTQLLNAHTSLETYRKNKELAKKVFNVAQIKYKEGVGSSLEVNEAESALSESETNYLNSVFEYLLNKVEYQKAKGELLNQYTDGQ